MTAPIIYPDGFPCPLTSSLQRTEGRLLSQLAGPRQSRVASRDKVRTRQVTFMLESPAQCIAWLSWGLSTLQNWAAWFSVSWPLPEGGAANHRFLGVPSYPQFVAGLNGWQVQATLQIAGRAMAPTQALNAFRFLNHFQTLRVANVASAIGPDLVLGGSAALTSTQSKFGGKSGEVLGFGDGFSAAVSPIIDMSAAAMGSWRIEGFFYDTADGGPTWFNFAGVHFQASIGKTTNPSFAIDYQIGGVTSSQGGSVGTGSDKPALNAWHHAGCQWDSTSGDFSVFCDGVTFAPVAFATALFDGSSINTVEAMQGSTVPAYISELALSAITVAELYGSTYTVPTAPFAPLTP